MKSSFPSKTWRRIRALAILALFLPVAGLAADRVSKPEIVITKPGQCVADTQSMRRDHMSMLMHQRDRTMREGVRSPQFSLQGCVDCHANAKTGSVLGKDGFCQSCHAFASVKLDCFECHTSRARTTTGALLPARILR